jgi:hypothetical protein
MEIDHVTYNPETRKLVVSKVGGDVWAPGVDEVLVFGYPGQGPNNAASFRGDGPVPDAFGEVYIREPGCYLNFHNEVLAADFRGRVFAPRDVLAELQARYGTPTSIRFGESTVPGEGPYSDAAVVRMTASPHFVPSFHAYQPYVRPAQLGGAER